jgi:hypothetical protein
MDSSKNIMKISYFKYVPLGFVHVWLAAGWTVTPALHGTHHGQYSELVEWRGAGDPVIPHPHD